MSCTPRTEPPSANSPARSRSRSARYHAVLRRRSVTGSLTCLIRRTPLGTSPPSSLLHSSRRLRPRVPSIHHWLLTLPGRGKDAPADSANSKPVGLCGVRVEQCGGCLLSSPAWLFWRQHGRPFVNVRVRSGFPAADATSLGVKAGEPMPQMTGLGLLHRRAAPGYRRSPLQEQSRRSRACGRRGPGTLLWPDA
jgi:hypothetical protein